MSIVIYKSAKADFWIAIVLNADGHLCAQLGGETEAEARAKAVCEIMERIL